MPRGDGTGPLGLGPLIGRGAGYCTGFSAPGYANPMLGRWFLGPRMGRGCGYRHWYYATGLPFWARMHPFWGWPRWGYTAPPLDKKTEIDTLKAEAAQLEEALKQIQERLAELQKED